MFQDFVDAITPERIRRETPEAFDLAAARDSEVEWAMLIALGAVEAETGIPDNAVRPSVAEGHTAVSNAVSMDHLPQEHSEEASGSIEEQYAEGSVAQAQIEVERAIEEFKQSQGRDN